MAKNNKPHITDGFSKSVRGNGLNRRVTRTKTHSTTINGVTTVKSTSKTSARPSMFLRLFTLFLILTVLVSSLLGTYSSSFDTYKTTVQTLADFSNKLGDTIQFTLGLLSPHTDGILPSDTSSLYVLTAYNKVVGITLSTYFTVYFTYDPNISNGIHIEKLENYPQVSWLSIDVNGWIIENTLTHTQYISPTNSYNVFNSYKVRSISSYHQ